MRKQNYIILLLYILLFSLLVFVLTQYGYTYVMFLLILSFVVYICFFSIQKNKTPVLITHVLSQTLILYRKNVLYINMAYQTKKKLISLFLFPVLPHKTSNKV